VEPGGASAFELEDDSEAAALLKQENRGRNERERESKAEK